MPTPILYVEDDDDVRTMLCELLASEGYDVVAFSTAEEAVTELEKNSYPVFVTDYNLPNRNADWMLNVASQRGLLTNTVVIVLSGAVDPKGIDGHQLLRKPVDVDVLLSTVEHALRGGFDEESTADHPRPPGSPTGAEVVLKLYFTGASSESRKAIRNLRRVLENFHPHLIRLDVHDVSDRAVPVGSLDEDRIVVTPTLVRKYPLPKLWILGDLSKVDVVEAMIHAGLSGTGSRRT